jgi:hypothetical protein
MAILYANQDRFADAAVEARKLDPSFAAALEGMLALMRRQPREAVKRFEAIKTFEAGVQSASAGSQLMVYITALAQAGETAKALSRTEPIAAKFPEECETRVMLAALRDKAGDHSAARRIVEPIIAAARASEASRSEVRCGPMAAAAIADAQAAASILTRIAADESYLRYWTLEITGTSGNLWLSRSWFPYDRIANDHAVAAAKDAIARAVAKLRETAAAVLAGLMEPGSPAASAQ